MKVTDNQKRVVVDFVERVSATFAEAFIAVALAQHGVDQTTAAKTAAVGGALAAGKFIYAKLDTFLHPPAA
jgi:hypothetical protein